MTQLSQLLIEVAISVLASGVAAAFLARRLRRLLIDACGTRERAEFWVVYCDAMIFIAPLLTMVVFGKSGQPYAPPLTFYKAALGSALFGVFLALSAIGLQIARLLPRPVGKGSET